MFVKITSFIYAEVADHDEAEQLAGALDLGLESQLPMFPYGKLEQFDVDTFAIMTDAQIDETFGDDFRAELAESRGE